MERHRLWGWLLVAALTLPATFATALILDSTCQAQEPEGDEPAADEPNPPAPANGSGTGPSAPEIPGFVYVPSGTIQPGCTWDDYKARANNTDLKKELIYEVWGSIPPFKLEAFYQGRYEVTNAQWKHYLDSAFRVEHTANGTETLPDLAKRYVKSPRDIGFESEWKSIYALNCKTLIEAWKKADRKSGQEGAAPEKVWQSGWDPTHPPVDARNDHFNIAKFVVPAGVTLVFYSHVVPDHWYGWCDLSNFRIGREYVDVKAPAEQAFRVPDKDPVLQLLKRPLRDTDFGCYPVRNISPAAMLAFAEWCGGNLPTEYEFERSGRGDRPNTEQHTMAGAWAYNKGQRRYFAWADNERCPAGPLPVDDEEVQPGDSPYGARHLLGNVYEMTRTFYDYHPKVTPKPPAPAPDLTNYGLVAKGGSFGSRHQFIQLSARTPTIGGAWLELQHANRADTLGLRLVRHPRPGFDLMQHSLLRLTYDTGRCEWSQWLPASYAMPRMGGVDEVHFAEAKAPYVHVKERASAISFVPLWMTDLDDSARKRVDADFKNRKLDGTDYFVLGALRCDVPLVCGVKLSKQEEQELRDKRTTYAEFERKWKQSSRKKRLELEKERPEEPPAPDDYEKMTDKLADKVGLWRQKTIEPGEWIVVYWYGFIGLANRVLLMPPDAIIAIDKPREAIRRERKPADYATKVALDPENNRIRLRFATEEQLPGGPRKRQEPPRQSETELWALCEVLPAGWPGRKPGDYAWVFDVSLPTADGALNKNKWNKGE